MSNTDSRNLKVLENERQVRDRPTIIFGTNDEYGAAHGVQEVIDNSVDEAKEGHGNEIRIKIEADGVVTVSDDGRGLPMDWNEDVKKYNWELALCTLYSSGKYDASQYGNSAGLNGLGLTATQFASEFMDVTSTYNGYTYKMHFEKGKPVSKLQKVKAESDKTGTTIRFKPDVEVFPALRVKSLPAEYFIQMARRKAMLNDGLCIKFLHHEVGNEMSIKYDGGIVEFIDNILEKGAMKSAAFYSDSKSGTDDAELYPETYEVKMKLAFNFCRDTSLIEVYHNDEFLFETTRNLTLDALKFAITAAFTDAAREAGKMGRSDSFKFKDIESMLVCIAETSAPGHRTWFKNQTKGAVLNPFIKDSFTEFIYNSFRNWFEDNKDVSSKVLSEALTNKEAREEADKVSKKVVQKLSKGISFGNKPKKFVDCDTQLVAKREIYFVEGDSALTSTVTARDSDFQAVFPLRGKPINCLKEKITRVLNNDIIVDCFRVLGCGIEAKSDLIELPAFDISKLNYGKIIICTDADLDGNHIRALLLTMFYVLAPSLLKAGKVYIAETPLFSISFKDDVRFAFSENEREKVIKEFEQEGVSRSKLKIERSKGLGENDPEMMHVSTMSPLTRHLTKVEYPKDDSMLSTYFNALLGDDLETRKALIDQYFEITETNID